MYKHRRRSGGFAAAPLLSDQAIYMSNNQLPQIVVAGQMIVWHQCLERDRISWFLITKLRHYQNIHTVRLAPVVVEHH